MKRYIKSSDEEFRYTKFSEAIEDNYDKIMDLAETLDTEAYNEAGMRVVIEIDLDGFLDYNWYPAMSNDFSSDVFNGITYPVVELCHAGSEEQGEINRIAVDNFFYALNNAQIEKYEREANQNGYDDVTSYVEDKFSNEIEEERQYVIEDLVKEDCEYLIPDQIDSSIKETKYNEESYH